jgi:hypothetical protein
MNSRAALLSRDGQPRFQVLLYTTFFLATAILSGTIAGCGGSSPSGHPPTNLAYPQVTITATAGQPITTDTPTATGTVSSYSVSPTLPAGLSLNTTTGAISGTPTVVATQAAYIITATNSAGDTTATIQIVVNAAVIPPSNLTYSQPTISATVGQAISTDTPTVTGTVSSYSVSPTLPAGLSLNTTTGAISGTPTAVAAQATYTITATNSAGNTTATVQILVNAAIAAPSNLAYPLTTIAATAGQAISTDTPTVTGTVSSYSVSPTLPAGLSLNTTTGAISGTPTAVAAQATYTITATNSAGNTTATVQILVNAAIAAPSNLAYPLTTIAATAGQAISTDTPTVTGTVTSYSVSPALPAGLSLNTSTGAISGTPTAVAAQTTYTITATNSAGNTSATVQITVIAPAAPTSLVYPQTTIVTSVGQTVPSDIPVLTGSGIANYTVSPTLPAGLSLNLAGSISGVPTAASPQTTYTITASNFSGSTSASVTITVNSALPVLLDVGHATYISQLRVSPTRVLSQDLNNHWVLWDYTSDTEILSGDQIVPPFQPAGIHSWPVDMAGQVFVIGQTNGVDIRSVTDGHVVFQLQSSSIDSAQGGTWWKLATDGSYFCFGSQFGVTIESAAGQPLLTLPGDFSTAQAYAAPGQLLIALGPAGQNVIQTISLSNGTSAVGPAFSGTFNSWFTDGQRFFSNDSNTVYTYSSASALQSTLNLPTVENLTGQGNWFWTYQGDISSYPFVIYPVNSSAPAVAYTLNTDTVVIPSANTIGVLPFGTPSASVIDLSGSTPVRTDQPLPIADEQTYAATSASQWIVGNSHGVVLDGTTAATTPRYFGTGEAWSIAGGANYAAVATAIGKIYYFSPSASSPLVGAINFSSSKVALSTDSTVMVAAANITDSQYETDRTLNVYALPAGTLTYTIPYQYAINSTELFDFTLSGSGTVLGQILGTIGATLSQETLSRQVAPTTGGPIIWSDSPSATYDPIRLSPDGTLIAVAINGGSANAVTTIYKNGTLVKSVPGYAAGWIDNNQLLINTYTQIVPPPGPGVFYQYAGASIYDATGTLSSTPTLPEIDQLQPINSTSLYDPSNNEIFSLPSGNILYSSITPLTGAAAVAGSYVVFASGSRIVVDTQ